MTNNSTLSVSQNIQKFRSRVIPYMFAAPALILLFTFGFFPMIVAAIVSFTNLNISGLADISNIKYAGLNNYTKLFADPNFWQALTNTAIFALIGIPSVVLLSLAVA